jgi:hypothetical protein
VATLSIQQHQYLVRRQPAQRHGTQMIAAIRNGSARKVNRGREPLQNLRGFDQATVLDRGRGKDVHRNR